jgi:hypothetical protein
MQRILLGLGVLAVIAGGMAAPAAEPAHGQGDPKAPYKVSARYRIQAGRIERYRQYQAMLGRLEAAGLKKDKGWEGEEFYGFTFTGTMPLGGLDALFRDPAVRASVMLPDGYQPPAAGQGTALVRLHLSRDFGAGRQPELMELARAKLKDLKFVEAPAYNHHDHRIMIGRMPLDQLPNLLRDSMEVDIPLGLGQEQFKPFTTTVVKVTEVLPESGDYAPLPPPEAAPLVPADKPYWAKISPDLRRKMATVGEDKQTSVERVEVLLRSTPPPASTAWMVPFVNPPLYMDIDGRLGPVVTGRISYNYLDLLAAQSWVSTIRLPHAASPILPEGYSADTQSKPFRFVSMIQPQDMPRITGKVLSQQVGPRRVLVVGTDFRGYANFQGKGLPARTMFMDLTAELTPDIQPLPAGDDGKTVGEGTLLAVEYLKTHPAEEVVLARVEPTSPGQVAELAKVLNGGVWNTETIEARRIELNREQIRLENEQFRLQVQRRILQNSFPTERGIDSRAAWDKYDAERKKMEGDIDALGERQGRYNQFRRQFRQLRGVRGVLLAMYWAGGYPNLAGNLPVLRYLDQDLLRTAVWTQAVPVRGGQVWTGVFRDFNRDGVMEFADLPPAKRPDLNFLAWLPQGGQRSANLPQGVVVEVTLDWQEAHDPRLFDAEDDPFRQPIAPLQIIVLRQRDPEGKVLPSDIFEEVARTTSWPDRLENAPRWAQYQALLRFQVQQPGRYAIRIEGRAPTSTLPAGTAELVQERSEIKPKLVIDVADPASRQKGSAVLETFRTGE